MASAPELTAELTLRLNELRSQERYERQNESVGVLADEIQMNVVAFRRLIRGLGWQRRPAKPPPSPRRLRILSVGRARRAPRRSAPSTPAAPADVATLVERQLTAIDRILADLHGAHGTEPDRDARTIASVSRTLKELLRMRAQPAPSAFHDDNTMPTDIDEFRRDLARRIEAFVASHADGTVVDSGGTPET